MVYLYKAKILKIIDGDTVDAMVDLGFNVWIKERFRLYGVNTPESRTRNKEEKAKGLIAKKYVKDRINNKNVEIDITKGTGKYGRYLATIYYINDKNERCCLNQQLLDSNNAVEYYGGKR